MARDGWVSKDGSGPATRPKPTSSARGDSPSSSALARLMTTTAAAPSEIWDALPAVMVPSGEKAGLSRPNPSTVVSERMPSSVSTTSSSRRWRTVTGTISPASRPSLVAMHARWWLMAASSSCRARVMPARLAKASVPAPMWTSSNAHHSPSRIMESTAVTSPRR